MAENLTLARPYAEAAFRLANTLKALDGWQEALGRMALVAADARTRDIAGNPKVASEQIVQFFLDIAGKVGDEQKNFVRLLVDNERLLVLPEIYQLFAELKDEHEGVKQAYITSAFPLDDKAVKQLITDIEPRFKCKLKPSVSVNPELIGGVTIAVGDEVIDASVRGKLATMAAALLN